MKRIITIFILLIISTSVFSQTLTSEYQEDILTVQEAWKMGDKTYIIESTALLEGKVFIVKVLWDEIPSERDINDAKRVAQFALVKGYRNNAKNLRFLDQFSEVDMNSIGIALIYKSAIETTGYRFMFDSDEILGNKYSEGYIETPLKLKDDDSITKLGNEYWEILTNNEYHVMYDQLPTDIKDTYNKEQFSKTFNDLSLSIKDYQFAGYSHSIFIGNVLGGRLFNYMFWVKKSDAKGFMTLSVLERDGDIDVVGLNLNVNSFFK